MEKKALLEPWLAAAGASPGHQDLLSFAPAVLAAPRLLCTCRLEEHVLAYALRDVLAYVVTVSYTANS